MTTSDTSTITALQNGIELKKQNIAYTVSQLQSEVNSYKDWRSIVKKHPLLALGVAVGVGLLGPAAIIPSARGTARSTKGVVGSVVSSSLSAWLSREAEKFIHQKIGRY